VNIRPRHDATGASRTIRARSIVAACDRDGVNGNYGGVFLVVVGGALFALLVLGGRAGRSLLRDVWGRLGLLRWVLVVIVVVVVLDLADGVPNR
jgi:hypothetical protein